MERTVKIIIVLLFFGALFLMSCLTIKKTNSDTLPRNLRLDGIYVHWNEIDTIIPIDNFWEKLELGGAIIPDELAEQKNKFIHPNSSCYTYIKFFDNKTAAMTTTSAFEPENAAKALILKNHLLAYSIKNDSIFFEDGTDIKISYRAKISLDTLQLKRKIVINENYLNQDKSYTDQNGTTFFNPQFEDADSLKIFRFVKTYK